jgi:hypothetical protein
MDAIIGSTNTPIKHINKLPNKPWRFKCNVIAKKKGFQKETNKKRKKDPLHIQRVEAQPDRVKN